MKGREVWIRSSWGHQNLGEGRGSFVHLWKSISGRMKSTKCPIYQGLGGRGRTFPNLQMVLGNPGVEGMWWVQPEKAAPVAETVHTQHGTWVTGGWAQTDSQCPSPLAVDIGRAGLEVPCHQGWREFSSYFSGPTTETRQVQGWPGHQGGLTT